MRKYVVAAACASFFPALAVRASLSVEQIEAYEVSSGDDPMHPTRYAPLNFDGATQVTLSNNQLGNYGNGITFHAVSGTTSTDSSHALSVGGLFYANGSVAYPYATDVYNAAADLFIPNVVMPQAAASASGPVPGHFDGGARIINNSYVDSELSNQDTQRRWDFMIDRDDVTFAAAAANTDGLAGDYLDWSAFNSLAVRGDDGFNPSGSPGKQHADLGNYGHASFVTARVSGYAVGLYGHAQAAAQSNALHGVVMRSLLMAGADKTIYTRQTANNLDTLWGAGQANYTTSLNILQGGEQSASLVGSGSSTSGSPTWSANGWSYLPITAGTTSAVMFHADAGLTGLTASLNWNVTQSQPTPGEIDTTDAGTQFPNLTLEVRPVNLVGGQYVLGASSSDVTLHSNATNDNVQYLYFTNTLPAGTYAFVISDTSALSTHAGFSYSLVEPLVNQWKLSTGGSWNNSGNWSSGIPSGQGARAYVLASNTGLTTAGTITLDGNQTVGRITFDNSNCYTISQGTGGTLTVDDTNGVGGSNPSMTVVSGNHAIVVPVSLVNGITLSTASGSALTLSGNVSGTGNVISTGSGVVTLAGANSYSGNTTVNGGTLNLTGSITSNQITIASGAILNASGASNGGLPVSSNVTANGVVNFAGTPPVAGPTPLALASLTLGASGSVNVADPGSGHHPNRTVLITSALSLPGSSNAWSGQLDLAGNDMVVRGGDLSTITDQIKTGYQLGAFTGNGITSSAAKNDGNTLTTLGVLLNTDSNGHTLYDTFDNQSVGVTDVLVKYTYYGDANLDGTVNSSDYSQIDNGFNGSLTGWYNGDFNYDGIVNSSDYSLIDNAFNQTQGLSLSSGSTANLIGSQTSLIAGNSSTVPEPGPASLLGLGAIGLLRRRHRK